MQSEPVRPSFPDAEKDSDDSSNSSFEVGRESNLNVINSASLTPLHTAVIDRNWRLTERILDHGADIDERMSGPAEYTALAKAVEDNSIKIVRLLLYRGADPNAVFKPNGETALFIAAQNNNIEIARLLLEWGAYVQPYLNSNPVYTPLIQAAHAGHVEMVKFLLQEGAQLYDRQNKDQPPTPFWERVAESMQGNLDLITFLRLYTPGRSANPIQRDLKAEMSYFFFHAAKMGDEATLRRLLAHGADVSWTDKAGNTALHLAATEGHFSCVLLLIKSGAYVNYPNNNQESPLLLAVKSGKLKIARLLLDSAADVHQADYLGVTPLHAAAQEGVVEVAKLLLQRQAAVNEVDKQERTPLQYAAMSGKLAMVSFLLQAGAEIDAEDCNRETALSLALKQKHMDISKKLLESGATDNSALLMDQSSPVDEAPLLPRPTALHFAFRAARENMTEKPSGSTILPPGKPYSTFGKQKDATC